MSFLAKLAKWVASVLLPLGGKGLFVAAALDSSFIPLPEGVDLWLISLSVLQPARMPYYVIFATLGSLLGCCALYAVARWSDETFLESKPKYKHLPRIRQWVEKYETQTLFLGSLLPPPMPFKLVVIASGLVRGRFEKFLVVLLIGRLLRYASEGILAVRYGNEVWTWLLHASPWVFAAVAAAGVIYLIVWRLRRPASNGPA